MAKEDRGFASMDRAKQREIASTHGDGTWPDTQLVIEKAWGHIPPAELRAMCSENAASLFRHPLPATVLPLGD